MGELGYDIDQVLKREFLSYIVWNFLLTCGTALVSTPLLEIGAQYHQRSGSTTSTDITQELTDGLRQGKVLW